MGKTTYLNQIINEVDEMMKELEEENLLTILSAKDLDDYYLEVENEESL